MKAVKSYELSVSEREYKIVYECLSHCFEIAGEEGPDCRDDRDDYEALANMIDSMRKNLQ